MSMNGAAKAGKMFKAGLVLLLCLSPLKVLSNVVTESSGKSAGVNAVELDNDERMAWWREAKFGLFVHWGVYSVLAGEYKGESVPGIGEWIQYRKKIPREEYLSDYAGQFNPSKFNADDFVRMIRDAGMQYIVITAKHHDGFAMFDSDVSDYNIVDSSPYGKDPMKELATACKKHGAKLGFYYSHRIDWEHPDALCRRFNDWDYDRDKAEFERYWREKSMPQVEELMRKYGEVSLVWFDMATGLEVKYAQEMERMVRGLQPNILINSRLLDESQAELDRPLFDYVSTSDNYIHPQLDMKDWEAIMTTTDSWGYKAEDTNYRSAKDMVNVLVSIVSKGGNLLLNVGPDAKGLVATQIQHNLEEVGSWLKTNGEAVYGAGRTPFFRTYDWGVITHKPRTVYLNVFNWPSCGFIDLSGLKSNVKRVYALTEQGERPLSFKQKVIKGTEVDHLKVDLPVSPLSPLGTVIAVEYDGELDVDQGIVQDARCVTRLDYFAAERDDEAKTLKWNFKALRPGRYKVRLISSESQHHENPEWIGGGQAATLRVCDQDYAFVVKHDGLLQNFNQVPWDYVVSRACEIEIGERGDYTLKLDGLKLAYGKYRSQGLALNYVEIVPLEAQ